MKRIVTVNDAQRDALRHNCLFWREQLRLTQTALAKRAGLAQSRISDIEQGSARLTLDVVERLAAALETDLQNLFTPVPRGSSDTGSRSGRNNGAGRF